MSLYARCPQQTKKKPRAERGFLVLKSKLEGETN